MAKDKAYKQAEQKIAEALKSRATKLTERPDRFPRYIGEPESQSPQAIRLTASLVKHFDTLSATPVRSARTHPKGG